MSTPRNLAADQIVRDNIPFAHATDYVVPEYNENGTATTAGNFVVAGAENRITELIREHATSGGAEPLVIPKSQSVATTTESVADGKKRKKQRTPIPTPTTNTPPIAPSNIEVVFSTSLGKIKVNILSMIEISTALLLVFRSPRDITYEPAPGTSVEMLVNGRVLRTMYPGFRFKWLEDERQLLLFVKLED